MARAFASSKKESPGQPSAEELASALKLLDSILGTVEQQDLFHRHERMTSKMVYTQGVTIWMLILQRLYGGQTLDEVVTYVLSHDHDLFPDNKRVREKTLSDNSGAYSQARMRLGIEAVFEFSKQVCDHLGQISEPVIAGRRLFILDGTTISLSPTAALKEAYPPALNQHGESVWPIAQLMIANEMQSGCAMLPQIDPKYGDNRVGEATQASRIVQQLPENSIVMGDSGFGIYSVAHHSTAAGHDFLFRLSHVRFKALRRRADLFDEGELHKTYRLRWTPSVDDRKSTPDLPPDASIEVVLHEVQINSKTKHYFVSNLEFDGPSVSKIYCRRYDVEFDIRDLKITLDAENIRAKSVEMFKKEFYASIVAYNLVAQFRRQAAAVSRIHPRRLSFKGVWNIFKECLLKQPSCTAQEWIERYQIALARASKKKHPKRKQPRDYPRAALPRSPKSTKFQKAQRRNKMNAEEKPKPQLEPN
jgi:hypothetical protein